MPEVQNQGSIKKRPIVITVICVVGFLGALLLLFVLLFPNTRDILIQLYGKKFLYMILANLCLGLTGLIGFWKMRKWGVYFYALMIISSVASSIVMKLPQNKIGYIIPLVIIGTGIYYFRDMR